MTTPAVAAFATDDELDDLLGGQGHASTTLRPASWDNLFPALTYAYDELGVQLSRCVEGATVERGFALAPVETKRALLFLAAARLYELAATTAVDGSIMLRHFKTYTGKYEHEETRVCDKLRKAETGPPSTSGARSPYTFSYGRR